MTVPAKLLMICVDETDRWDDQPLYEALVHRLRHLGAGGATVTAGIMGFGSEMNVHHRHLFGISDDKPILIQVCDTEEKIRSLLPAVRAMVEEGLIVVLDCERVTTGGTEA